MGGNFEDWWYLEDYYQDIVCIVQRRLLVIEWREAHALEMPAITFLAPHHDPHSPPLCSVHWLYHERDFIDKADGSRDMVKHINLLDLQRISLQLMLLEGRSSL